MFWTTHRNILQKDLTEHLLSEDFEMKDLCSKMIVDANVVQSPAAALLASCAPGAANWFRKVKGMNDSKEKAFIVDLAESETSNHNLANDEPRKADDAEIVGARLKKYDAIIDTYEGRHRYDPKAKWAPEEEKRLARRYSNLTFLAAGLPSQLVSKKIGPDNWIPIQMITWSIVASCQSRINSRTTFWLTPGLMGALEGGFIPNFILHLSCFYTSDELPIRLSFFWVAYAGTYIISALLMASSTLPESMA